MNAFVDPRSMLPEITRHLFQCPVLAELSNRCSALDRPSCSLERDVWRLARIRCADLTSSVDVALRIIRVSHRDGEWALGFQDVAYETHTGPMAWLNNRRPQKVGFANDVDPSYRYYARTGRTLEGAMASLALWAESYRRYDRSCG